MQLDVLNIEGKKTGRSVKLSDQIFGVEPNDHLIYMAVKQYLAGKHRGTHKTKGRSEVAGSTRKLHRQKGTGGSRKGDIKNPLYHGGGTVFGPRPHSYGFKMNRKEKDLAKISALTYKATGDAIHVVENLKLEAPKTKTLQTALQSLEIAGKKVLYVTAEYEENLFLSLRNLSKVKNITLSNINTYDIMNSNYLLLSEDAAKILADDVEEAPEKKEEVKAESKKEGTKKVAAKKSTKTSSDTKEAKAADSKEEKAADTKEEKAADTTKEEKAAAAEEKAVAEEENAAEAEEKAAVEEKKATEAEKRAAEAEKKAAEAEKKVAETKEEKAVEAKEKAAEAREKAAAAEKKAAEAEKKAADTKEGKAADSKDKKDNE